MSIATELSVHALGKLFGDREAWSPARVWLRGKKLLLAAGHPITHARIQATLEQRTYGALRLAYPRTPFKYLEADYLLRGLTMRERASCLLLHYRTLAARLPEEFLQRLPVQEMQLLELRDEGGFYSVAMNVPELFTDEGELSLHLLADGELVFVLSFTVVPGRVVQADAEEALLITRLQGVPGKAARIREATRAMHSVAPAALLLAVLQGIGEAWEIRELAGVCAERHRSYEEKYAAQLTAAYDEFFLDVGAVRNEAGFYVSQMPLPVKPLRQVKAGHKLRTREKRAFKNRISQETARLFAVLAQKNPYIPMGLLLPRMVRLHEAPALLRAMEKPGAPAEDAYAAARAPEALLIR